LKQILNVTPKLLMWRPKDLQTAMPKEAKNVHEATREYKCPIGLLASPVGRYSTQDTVFRSKETAMRKKQDREDLIAVLTIILSGLLIALVLRGPMLFSSEEKMDSPPFSFLGSILSLSATAIRRR
jgi:hypothetical protein